MQEKPRDSGLTAFVGDAVVAAGLAVLVVVLALAVAWSGC